MNMQRITLEVGTMYEEYDPKTGNIMLMKITDVYYHPEDGMPCKDVEELAYYPEELSKIYTSLS